MEWICKGEKKMIFLASIAACEVGAILLALKIEKLYGPNSWTSFAFVCLSVAGFALPLLLRGFLS